MGVLNGIIKNGAASVFQKLVRVLDQLLLIPLFLSEWGVAYYGEWLTISIIPSVLALSDLGIGTAVGNSFTLRYLSNSKNEAADILKSGLYITSCVIVCVFALLLIVMSVCNIFNAFDDLCVDYKTTLTTILFLMGARLIVFYTHIAGGFYRAVRMAAMSKIIQSVYGILNMLVTAICLCCGSGMVVVAFALMINSILYTTFFYWYGRSFIDFSGYKGVYSRVIAKDVFKKGLGYMSDTIWQSIYYQGSTFVVRIVVGVESVTMFNTIRTVCRSVSQLYSITNESVYPELQYEYGRGNIQTVRRVFSFAVFVSMLLGIFGGIILAIWGLDLYSWWTKSMIDVPLSIWRLFIVGIVLNSVWWTSTVIYKVVNNPYHYAISGIIFSIISVTLSYIFAHLFGLIGVVCGAVLFDLFMAIYILRDSCRTIGLSVTTLFKSSRESFNILKMKISSFCHRQ